MLQIGRSVLGVLAQTPLSETSAIVASCLRRVQAMSSAASHFWKVRQTGR